MRDAALELSADVPAPQAKHEPAWIGRALAVGVAGMVFWLAFDGGSYGVAKWTTVAIVVWWALVFAVATGLSPRGPVPRSAWLVGGMLTAFAVFTGLSALWATGADAPLTEMARNLFYVGAFGIAAMGVGRRADRWCDGVALGLVAITVLALTRRFFPATFPDDGSLEQLPDATTRLAYPVGYWNGLAILVALACPLLIRAAVAARSVPVRTLALVPLPAIAATIYLASSRTGAVTALVGILGFVALSGRRWAAAGAAVLGISSSIATLFYVAGLDELVNGPLDSGAATDQGRRATAVVLIAGLAAAATYALLVRALREFKPWPRLGWIVTGVLAVAFATTIVAVDPQERWQNFTRHPDPVAQSDSIGDHFASTNGNWRWQYWMAAVDQFETEPLVGQGAGTYEEWWAHRGDAVGFIRNAHSLYFETLGELGIVGLALLLAAVATGIAAGVRKALRAKAPLRDATAAGTAVFAAFAVGAGVDWIWTLPAVSIVGLGLLGIALGSTGAAARADVPLGRRMRILVAAISVAVLALQVDMLAADAKLRESRGAVARGDLDAAAGAARTSRRLQPWAASPLLQLALVEETRGELASARRWILEAIEHDAGDWRLRLIDARIETKLGRIQEARYSYLKARELNPRSPIFARTSSDG